MTTPRDYQTGSRRGSAQGGGGQMGSRDEGVKEKAQRMASDAGEKAKDTIESNVDRGKHRLAHTLHSFADSLRYASNHLREEDPNAPNQFFDRAAEQMDRFSNFVEGQDLDRTAREIESFARRQPAIFLGGAFLLGLAGARFLKSTRRGDQDYDVERGYSTGGYAQRGYGGAYADRSGYGAGAYGGSIADREIGGGAPRDWSRSSPADVSMRGGSGMSSGMGGTGSGGRGAGGATGTGTSRGSSSAAGAGIGETGGAMGARGGTSRTTERGGGLGGTQGGSARPSGGSTRDRERGDESFGGGTSGRQRGGSSSGSGGASGGQP